MQVRRFPWSSSLPRSWRRCLRILRSSVKTRLTREAISNATLVSITVGLFLFFLAGYLPDSNEEKITKMRRAFQTAWLWVSKIGGDGNRAREWLELFNSSLLNSGLLTSDPTSRMAIALSVLKDKFPSSSDAQSALEILPYLVLFGPMKTIKSISIT